MDVCSRIESVSEKIWTEAPIRVPAWVNDLVSKIVSTSGVPFMRPTMRVTRLPCPTTFGGRWFHKRNGIGLVLHNDRALTRGVLVHEVAGHWQRWVFGGDEAGEHDANFYKLMEEMYPLYGVPLSIAKQIEQRPPKHWLERETW